ncbi:hypothetical protein A9F13_17g00286 [Clavispora lusitaniae]|uniref:Uncharacterized protein n=1 Tax=Clavispora lusitaniae TaxID=36911 RepID=A0AA91PWH3_CLALS|nr:hypothetical protein A9F13_17g00286 [Clavispora lusitaniae]
MWEVRVSPRHHSGFETGPKHTGPQEGTGVACSRSATLSAGPVATTSESGEVCLQLGFFARDPRHAVSRKSGHAPAPKCSFSVTACAYKYMSGKSAQHK